MQFLDGRNRIFSKNLHLGQLSYDILEGKEERSGSFEESDLQSGPRQGTADCPAVEPVDAVDRAGRLYAAACLAADRPTI